MTHETKDHLESNVEYYRQLFPATFSRALGATIWDTRGQPYIDLFCGAGALNYGHNPEELKRALIKYIENDGIVHCLDMATPVRDKFVDGFCELILRPRNLNYRLMFPGPSGTDAVEASMKLARNLTGRTDIVAFTGAFHGVSLGSLAASSPGQQRRCAGVPLNNIIRMPYDQLQPDDNHTITLIETLIAESGDESDKPAAIIVELVQGEGGVNVASRNWLWGLAQIAKRHEILLIVDDIQAGCGRTGSFFSFEGLGIEPDLICLSKSLSGFGIPLSLVLIRPELDIWKPGDHTGTFRANNLACVTARKALEYWQDAEFLDHVSSNGSMLNEWLREVSAEFPTRLVIKGRGMFRGLQVFGCSAAAKVSAEAFRRGLIIETCGRNKEVLKLIPPLNISPVELQGALSILEDALSVVFSTSKKCDYGEISGS